MLIGAEVFSLIEYDREQDDRAKFKDDMMTFRSKYNDSINMTDFDNILKIYTEADKKGFLETKRPRWDFSGAFYFVCTVVSTIGKYKWYHFLLAQDEHLFQSSIVRNATKIAHQKLFPREVIYI